MGIYCLGFPGIGLGAMILSFFLAFLQVRILDPCSLLLAPCYLLLATFTCCVLLFFREPACRHLLDGKIVVQQFTVWFVRLQMVIAVKFGTQLEYDAIMTKS